MNFTSNYLLVSLLCLGGIWNARAQDIQVEADFPGGNIIVEKIDGDTVTVHQDRRDTKDWWFYWCFRVRGAAGKTLTFNFTDGAPIGVRGPAMSLDEGATWKWLGEQPDTKSFIFKFPAAADSVRFSFGMPYTEANLKRFLARVGPNRALKQETLCQSRKGRAVERLRVGKVDQLRKEFADAGKPDDFDKMKSCLMAERGAIDYASVAEQLGLNEGAARVAIHRLRKRFREIYREEISQTLSKEADLEGELRHLAQSLTRA